MSFHQLHYSCISIIWTRAFFFSNVPWGILHIIMRHLHLSFIWYLTHSEEGWKPKCIFNVSEMAIMWIKAFKLFLYKRKYPGFLFCKSYQKLDVKFTQPLCISFCQHLFFYFFFYLLRLYLGFKKYSVCFLPELKKTI